MKRYFVIVFSGVTSAGSVVKSNINLTVQGMLFPSRKVIISEIKKLMNCEFEKEPLIENIMEFSKRDYDSYLS